MSERHERLANEYGAALDAYLRRHDESALSGAYELGRRALGSGLGVLDMVALHQSAVDAMLAAAPLSERARLSRSAMDFFREVVSPFEMTLRGYREANERLASVHKRHVKRLRILGEIDRAVAASEAPYAIAGAVIQPLRDLLGVPRAIVNMFDLKAGQVEWLAAAGRRRTHVGPGVRYSMRMMGDLEALKRNEPQLIDTRGLDPGPEVDALLASGVRFYMVVPMVAGNELIGALSFGGEKREFFAEQMEVASEVATQLAIAVTQARLYERVRHHADELEQRVRERTAELQEANKHLESFSYSVAHDLRAPLRSIDGFSKALLDDHAASLDAEGRKSLNYVRDSARRMGQLIDGLLALARVARAGLERTDVDLSAAAWGIADRLQRADPKRKAEFVIEESVRANGDARLLTAVLENLISNAWKFTSGRESARIEFGRGDHDGQAVFFVRDNGAGFDMKYVDKLFGAFQRLHSSSEFEGTGIGLATVQRIIHRHGGRVWAEGKVDGGATISFSLAANGQPS